MRTRILEFLERRGLPEWPVPDYLFMLTAAIILGSVLTLWFCQRRGVPLATAQDLLFWGILGSLVGSKLLYVVQFGWVFASWKSFFFQGFALYGGLFGLLGAWLVYCRLRPFALGPFLDCATPGLAVGLALGRLGCFLAGCDGGRVSSLPWAFRFPPRADAFEFQVLQGTIERRAPLSLPAHPTQLYETMFALLLFGLTWFLLTRRTTPVSVFLTLVLGYALYRFATEPLRVDLGGAHPLGLTFSSFLSVAAILAGSLIVPLLPTRSRSLRDPWTAKPEGEPT